MNISKTHCDDQRLEESVDFHHSLKIFVAGLPSGTQQRELWQYFLGFGTISSIREFERSSPTNSQYRHAPISAPHKYGTKNQFCILHCGDTEAYNNILSFSDHAINRSQIFCSPFMEGAQLVLHNQSVNERRAVLRKVPSYISIDELRSILQKLFGPIESVYQFTPRNQNPTFGRRHFSFSVTFQQTLSLKKLLSLPEFKIGGQQVIYEQYNLKKRTYEESLPSQLDVDPRNYLTGGDQNSRNILFSEKISTREPLLNSRSAFEISHLRANAETQHSSVKDRTSRYGGHEQEASRQAFVSISSGHDQIISGRSFNDAPVLEYRRPARSEVTELDWCAKPTERRYCSSLSSRMRNNPSTDQTKNNANNYRFNLRTLAYFRSQSQSIEQDIS